MGKFSFMGMALAVIFLIIFSMEADAQRQRRQYTQSNNNFQNDFRYPRPNRPFPPNRPNRPPNQPNFPRCDFFCTANYDPVCALFGRRTRTFSNFCVFELERCRTGYGRFLYRGECRY